MLKEKRSFENNTLQKANNKKSKKKKNADNIVKLKEIEAKKKNINHHFNPTQDGFFGGCSRIGEQKGPPSLKSVTHILQ